MNWRGQAAPGDAEIAPDTDETVLADIAAARRAAARTRRADGDTVLPGTTMRDDAANEAEARDETAAAAAEATVDPAQVPPAKKSGLRRLRGPLLALAPIALIAGGLWYWLEGGQFADTDNAQLQTGLVEVSPNIAGRVIAVEVRDNQQVRKGDVLFRIDPAPYLSRVRAAEAQLAQARTGVFAAQADYRKGVAQLGIAQAQVTYADREAARQRQLLAEGISSQAQYDQAVLAARTARQQIASAGQTNQANAARLAGSVSGSPDQQPAVQAAQAALDTAKLELSYTTVRAPQDGTVAKVSQLQVGDYVSATRPVFSMAGNHIWVEANYKEDQLRYMRLGQPATVTVDAFPDVKLKGRVTGFSPGTGNSFAVLPAENATGNWVKVTQRLPVEVTLDSVPASIPLHAGLSVEVSVDTGHKRHLIGPDTPPSEPRRAGA